MQQNQLKQLKIHSQKSNFNVRGNIAPKQHTGLEKVALLKKGEISMYVAFSSKKTSE